jgi:hypothetical protein
MRSSQVCGCDIAELVEKIKLSLRMRDSLACGEDIAKSVDEI